MYLTAAQLDTIRTYFAARPVKRAWLFGSYARGEADAASDVDLLVVPDFTAYVGIDFFYWPDELRELLGIPVDVVSERSLNRHVRPYVEHDRLLIYERPT